jgi:T5SS/PEP-CTERM-associated repeat protein
MSTASLSHPFIAVGGAGSTGVVDVNDAELNAGANLVLIDAGGSATLAVEAGGNLFAGSLFVAEGGSGTVYVKGTLTTVTIGSGGLGIGKGGAGQLTLEQGAEFTVAGRLDVGSGGAGTVDIDTGATLTSVGAALDVLFNGPGDGTALLDAAEWFSSGQVAGWGCNAWCCVRARGFVSSGRLTRRCGTDFMRLNRT